MRNRILAIVAASAFISLTAVGTASADVVVSSSKVVSNGFTTCRSTCQTDIGPLGSASQRTKVCSSNLGGGGVGFGGGGLALQLRFMGLSKSMGDHNSKIVGAGSVD